ncbi:MAG: hypothetical protein FJW40_15650 [Acidobacteria bacterium]|nr:hypothetical protein [Acidobacteriota bacterium]
MRLITLLLLTTALPLCAQITGAITGSVLDASGGAVTGASVVVKNTGTGAERALTTDGNGLFAAEQLPVGLYEVTVSASGFKKAIHGGLQLNVASRLGVDIKLEVGQLADAVTVTAEAPLVKTETGEVSYLVTQKQITDLSISNRTFISLQQLIPGAARTAPDELGISFSSGRGFAINGQREKYSGLMVDGVQNTDMGNQNGLMTYPGLETISEVKILSSNYSAEYGTAGGANMLLVTRTGTQRFHASAYEYLRNDKLDARNFFAISKPPLRLNNFGYRVDGPVILPGYNKNRDKTFFFFSQEWRKRRSAQIVRSATPTAEMRRGLFPTTIIDPASGAARTPFPGNQIPGGRQNRNAQLLLNHLFPQPTLATGFLNFQANFSVPEDFRQELIRVDHNFTDKTKVMFRYINDSWVQQQPLTLWSGQSFPTISTVSSVPGKNIVAKVTKIFSPTVLTEVSFNYAENYGPREKDAVTLRGNFLRPDGLTVGRLAPLPQGRPNKVPDLSFAGGWGGISSSYYPWWAHHAITTLNNITTKNIGRHALRFGGEYQFSPTPVQSQTNPSLQGAFSFSGAFTSHPHADMLVGQASTYGELQRYVEPRYDYHQIELFLQDDWKVNSRLTLNLGVRYFGIPHAYEKDDLLTVFRPERWDIRKAPTVLPDLTLVRGPNTDLLNGIAGVKDGLPRGLVQNHPWTFGPRFGFAYDVTGQARTVLRGGYGIGYFRVEGNDVYSLVGNPPLGGVVQVFNPPLDDPSRGSAGADRPRSVVTLDPIYKIPYVQTYSLGVQQQVASNTALTISYVGSRGVRLDRGRQLNHPFPAGGFDFDPRINPRTIPFELLAPYYGWSTITQRENTASSTYHSLQTDFTRSFSNGLRFQGVYTWSKVIADAENFGALPQNPYNRAAERSLASFDRTHVAVFNYTYELPFFRKPANAFQSLIGGWQMNGITAFQSGRPFNIGLAGTTIGLAQRPDVVPGQSAKGSKTVAQWFNTNAFRFPAFGRYGNAGRNLVRGPGINKWDFSLFKNFRVKERGLVQFRWEMFNMFNNANFEGVSGALGAANFGQVVSARDPRTMQFGLKVEF